jgi:hypothetical protein
MCIAGWVCTLAGIWIATGTLLGLIAGPLLGRVGDRYPLPADEDDPTS